MCLPDPACCMVCTVMLGRLHYATPLRRIRGRSAGQQGRLDHILRLGGGVRQGTRPGKCRGSQQPSWGLPATVAWPSCSTSVRRSCRCFMLPPIGPAQWKPCMCKQQQQQQHILGGCICRDVACGAVSQATSLSCRMVNAFSSPQARGASLCNALCCFSSPMARLSGHACCHQAGGLGLGLCLGDVFGG